MTVEIGVVYFSPRAFPDLFRGFLMNPRNKWVEINQVFCSEFMWGLDFFFFFWVGLKKKIHTMQKEGQSLVINQFVPNLL